MSEKSFLSHVAGLRALAILLVVWFHISLCNPNLPESATLPCGYYGVDIFFVISGYFLIAGFVRRPDCSLLTFAKGKALRIIPPLAIMVLLSFAACIWVMDFKEIRAIAKTGLGALLGYSNYQLLDTSSGYFAEDSTLNAYLHTWYLSVTLQVFAISYVLFAVLRNCSRACVLRTIAIIAAVSLLWNQAGNIRNLLVMLGTPKFGPRELVSYYDTLPRLWEIAAGGVVMLLPASPHRWKSYLLSIVGLSFVLVPSLSSVSEWDLTLLVVVGTILIIRYLPDTSLQYLLSNPLTLWLGGISFSVYLVHMPLLVLYRADTLQAPDVSAALVLLLVSVLIGYAFWWAIEKRHISGKIAIAVWIAGVAICATADISRGLQKIWNADVNAIDIPKYTEWEACYDKSVLAGLDTALHCDEGGWHTLAAGKNKALDTPLLWLGLRQQQPGFVLMGDSHAQAFFAGFDICCKRHNLSGVYLSSIVVPFWNREVLPVTQQYYYNRKKGEALIHWLRQQEGIRTVIIAQYWTRMTDLPLDWDMRPVSTSINDGAVALREFCQQIRSCGKQLILLAPLPDFKGSKVLNYARWLARKNMPMDAVHTDYICNEDTYAARFADEIQVLRQLETDGLCKILYPADYMFKDGVCKAVDNGLILYKDSNHITGVGSSIVLEKLMPALISELHDK